MQIFHFPNVESVPEIGTATMIEVDRLMIEDYDISLLQMMENAGRSLAILAREKFLGGDARGKRIAVLAGSGGNGGGALTAARRLAIWGAEVHYGLTRASEAMKDVPAHQLSILSKLPCATPLDGNLKEFDLILDGLIGYSLRGAPSGAVLTWIKWANDHPVPTLSLDVPSGYDSETARYPGAAVSAAATMTLALPKKGLTAARNAEHVGELYCADISVPPDLYGKLNPPLSVNGLFASSDIVRIR